MTLLTGAIALVAASLSAPSIANADSSLLLIGLTPLSAPVQAGDPLGYEISASCSNPAGCGVVTATLTAPPSWVPVDGPPIVNFSAAQLAGGETYVANSDGSVVITVPHAPVGISGAAPVYWPTKDYVTLPGAQPVTASASDSSGDVSVPQTATSSIVASPNLAQSKSGSATSTLGGGVSYTIQTSNIQNVPSTAAGGLGLTNAVVTDVLPVGVTNVVPGQGGTYDLTTNTVTWPTIPLLGGPQPGTDSQGNLYYQLSYSLPATGGPSFTDHAGVTGTPVGGGAPVSAASTATTTVSTGPPTLVTGVHKFGDATLSPGDTEQYDVEGGNGSNVVTGAQVTDTVPAGLAITGLGAYANDSSYNSNQISYVVTYSDNSTATFAWTSGTVDVTKPGLTAVSVAASLPNENAGQNPFLFVITKVDPAAVVGSKITNCADETVTAPGLTAVSSQSCTTATVVPHLTDGDITKTLTNTVPAIDGQALSWKLDIYGGTANEVTRLQPEIVDLIPTQLTYVAGSFAAVAGNRAGCPAASGFTVTLTPNYLNGRTALIATANAGVTVPAQTDCYFSYQTTVNNSVPAGTYGGANTQPAKTVSTYPIDPTYQGNDSYLLDARGYLNPNLQANTNAANITKDGNTSEGIATSTADFSVAVGPGFIIQKSVQGDQDSAFLGSAEVDPTQVGTSTVGGTVSYRVVINNRGNVPLTNLVAYDLLPLPGNHGVVASRYSDMSDINQWTPTLTGPIDTGSDPVTVYYSTNPNPCRPEMDVTRSEPFYCGGNFNANSDWEVASAVTDWSAIRAVRFDYGTTIIQPATIYTYTWTMKVPLTRADGTAFVGGETTWNKVAIQAAEDISGNIQPQNPAEAPWVEDRVYVPPTYAIGDYVWADKNADGIQDNGEAGIPGVTVELTDASGNPVNDFDGNSVAAVTTDANGAYHFDNLASGTYRVKFIAPSGSVFTAQTAGADVTVDSNPDGTTGITAPFFVGTPAGTNNTVASTTADGVTANFIDRTIDAGIVTPSLSLVKSVTETQFDAIGNTLHYSFVVTNTGSTPLSGIVINDPLVGLSTPFCPSSTLAIGTSETCTATYAVTAADLRAGSVANTATASADATGTTVSATSAESSTTLSDVTYAVGDYVWLDANKNGVLDAGETKVPGVTVTLTDDVGNPVHNALGNLVEPTTTDSTGNYRFDGLTAGTYKVTFAAPSGYRFTTQGQGSDNAIDSNANTTTGTSDPFTLGAPGVGNNVQPSMPSDDVTSPFVDSTIDAGLVLAPVVKVLGFTGVNIVPALELGGLALFVGLMLQQFARRRRSRLQR